MPSRYTFTHPRLVKLDGFQVQLDESHERGDIILNRTSDPFQAHLGQTGNGMGYRHLAKPAARRA